jgi:hypothetical protein
MLQDCVFVLVKALLQRYGRIAAASYFSTVIFPSGRTDQAEGLATNSATSAKSGCIWLIFWPSPDHLTDPQHQPVIVSKPFEFRTT